MLLSEAFADHFGRLPEDVEKHPAVWQEVSSCSSPRELRVPLRVGHSERSQCPLIPWAEFFFMCWLS